VDNRLARTAVDQTGEELVRSNQDHRGGGIGAAGDPVSRLAGRSLCLAAGGCADIRRPGSILVVRAVGGVALATFGRPNIPKRYADSSTPSEVEPRPPAVGT
jgi:hypothetical protein